MAGITYTFKAEEAAGSLMCGRIVFVLAWSGILEATWAIMTNQVRSK